MTTGSLVLVVAFAFATPPEAWANCILRSKVRKILATDRSDTVWVYTQPDLAQGLADVFKCKVIKEEEGEPSPTLRIARGAVSWAQEIGAAEIRIVASRPHMWRCVRDVKMAMREAGLVLPLYVEGVYEVRWRDWFDATSSQPRTSSMWAWLRRDVILWLMPWAIYKRIAG